MLLLLEQHPIANQAHHDLNMCAQAGWSSVPPPHLLCSWHGHVSGCTCIEPPTSPMHLEQRPDRTQIHALTGGMVQARAAMTHPQPGPQTPRSGSLQEAVKAVKHGAVSGVFAGVLGMVFTVLLGHHSMLAWVQSTLAQHHASLPALQVRPGQCRCQAVLGCRVHHHEDAILQRLGACQPVEMA